MVVSTSLPQAGLYGKEHGPLTEQCLKIWGVFLVG